MVQRMPHGRAPWEASPWLTWAKGWIYTQAAFGPIKAALGHALVAFLSGL